MSAASPGSCSTSSRSIQEQGADYIAALLNGYEDAPQGFTLPAGAHYNEYFPGHAIAHAAAAAATARSTTTTARRTTVDQYAKDVTAFMMWAAEPHMEARKRIGFQVMIFLIVLRGPALLHQEEGVGATAH